MKRVYGACNTKQKFNPFRMISDVGRDIHQDFYSFNTRRKLGCLTTNQILLIVCLVVWIMFTSVGISLFVLGA